MPVRNDWQDQSMNDQRSEFRLRFANDEIMLGASIMLDTTSTGLPCFGHGHKPRLDLSYQYP